MANITNSYAATALQLLADAALECQEEVRAFDEAPEVIDSDEEKTSDAPIFDQFYDQGGSTASVEMITLIQCSSAKYGRD